ncbi:MAG: hypothetical protein PHP64_08670 [Actinomycetota bacterium]|nr:hypothetical protein [Actinomycetota bacterium]
MKKEKELSEEESRKAIGKAEKKALKLSAVDQGLIKRFWELMNMWPKITLPGLEDRIERFILNATPGQFFQMQVVLFEEATPYLMEDPKVKSLIGEFSGRQIGLAVEGEYESTVTIMDCYFKIERGIKSKKIPVISISSRQDYADVVLGRKDPIRLILQRKIKATHKMTLLKWALPNIDIIRDESLFDKYLSYQNLVEEGLDENFKKMGY